jgi:hypothetical protein
MKAFQCGRCGQPLFFHNKACLGCGSLVAYDPTSRLLGALDPGNDDRWTLVVDDRDPKPAFRFCEHREDAVECNWLIPADTQRTACLACRLTRTIPDLSNDRNRVRLQLIETAKRRVLYGLQNCRLPIVPKDEDAQIGLAFDLLEEFPGGWRVMTGHSEGTITLNVAEADADYRERHRETFHEPYRTLIGHIRHEIGHYYWDRLIENTDWLPKFRELFGDEQADYAAALQNYYDNGPTVDWADRFISGYAAAHPWEDWAEIWAHYLHLRATLQTVESFSLDTSKTPFRITPFEMDALFDAQAASAEPFLGWINAWVKLTTVLNETARSMGQPDVYPFVMNKASVAKLHFVQCVIETHGGPPVEPPPVALLAVQ